MDSGEAPGLTARILVAKEGKAGRSSAILCEGDDEAGPVTGRLDPVESVAKPTRKVGFAFLL